MRLLLVSHTPHYRSGERFVGWGPTVREIDQLASLFDEVVHVAPLHEGMAPPSELPYRAANVRVVPVRPAGGLRLGDKIAVMRAVPGYAAAIRRELGRCDAVHVRCPSNISLIATLLLIFRARPSLRWIKYAGNWKPPGRESFSYRLQRWILDSGVLRARVTVNGRWPGQPAHIRSFLNPCLTAEEIREGAAAAESKALEAPVRLLFVGRLDFDKGCGRALEVLSDLKARGIRGTLEIVGDGPLRGRFEAAAAALRVTPDVRFAGWLSRQALGPVYARAHFLLLPSTSSEGWPKVLSEGMAYGVVPITSDVSAIPQLLREFRTGRALGATDRSSFVAAIAEYVESPALWKSESRNAVEAARAFAYETYLEAVRSLLGLETA